MPAAQPDTLAQRTSLTLIATDTSASSAGVMALPRIAFSFRKSDAAPLFLVGSAVEVRTGGSQDGNDSGATCVVLGDVHWLYAFVSGMRRGVAEPGRA